MNIARIFSASIERVNSPRFSVVLSHSIYTHIKTYIAFDMRRALGILMPIKKLTFPEDTLRLGEAGI